MEYLAFFAIFIAGCSLARMLSLQEQVRTQGKKIAHLEEENAALREQERHHISLVKEHEMTKITFQEVQRYIVETNEQLIARMKTLSQEVVTSTQAQFFTTAKTHFEENHKQVLTPLKISLDQMYKKVIDLEMLRKESQANMLSHVAKLSKETALLIKALRHPTSRGKWGEMQLKRLVEMAGLLEKCDFSVQETSSDGSLRADMIVSLPNNRKIIIDAKVPLEGYLKAIESEDPETYEKEIEGHVEQLEKHIKLLSDKKYWGKYHGSIDFTVLFLPSSALLATALEKRRNLMERALEKHVLLATPETLMALLHAVKLGWNETELHKDIHDIVSLAKEWVTRSSTFVDHLQKVGKSLSTAVGSYNAAVHSFESRFLVTMRKLAQEQMIGSGTALENIEPISVSFAPMVDIHEDAQR